MTTIDLFTIVSRKSRKPVWPLDDNPDSADKGMLVYFSLRAAELAAEHQAICYGVTCEAIPLDRLGNTDKISAEAQRLERLCLEAYDKGERTTLDEVISELESKLPGAEPTKSFGWTVVFHTDTIW